MKDLINVKGTLSLEDNWVITNPIFTAKSKEECEAIASYLKSLKAVTFNIYLEKLIIQVEGIIKLEWLNMAREEIKKGLAGPTSEQLQKFLSCINKSFNRDYSNIDWALEDTCDFIEAALDTVGYNMPDFIYNLEEYPEWYLAIEQIVFKLAEAYQILAKP